MHLMIITHETLGQSYAALAAHFFGKQPDCLDIIGMTPDGDPDETFRCACAVRDAAHARREAVLIMTDIFGATPANVARRLLDGNNTAVLTGLNAPMLVKALQYAPQTADLAVLSQQVENAARNGIMLLEQAE